MIDKQITAVYWLITKRELGLKFKIGNNTSEIDKILHYIYHLQGLILYNLRRGKKVHYCRKQIEVAKRKLNPFKSQLHPIELGNINL